MKNLNTTILIMSGLSGLFFSSCKNDNDWNSRVFTGSETSPKFFGPDIDSSLNKLDDGLKKIKSSHKISNDLKQKVLAYKKTSNSKIHESLLKLKGREVDLIGMIHVAGGSNMFDDQKVRIYQSEIVKLIEAERYQIMFTEDFSSDCRIIDSKAKIIADFRREAFDTGSRPTDDQIDTVVIRPILQSGVSASMRIALTNPAVTVVGIDWYPVKRIQQNFHFEMQRAFEIDEAQSISRSLSCARDIYLLCELAEAEEFQDKKSALVFGAMHIPHLAFLLKSYGASGKIWLKPELFKDVKVNEEFERFKLY